MGIIPITPGHYAPTYFHNDSLAATGSVKVRERVFILVPTWTSTPPWVAPPWETDPRLFYFSFSFSLFFFLLPVSLLSAGRKIATVKDCAVLELV